MAAMAWLQLRQILAGRKLWLLILLLALPILFTGVVVVAGEWRGPEVPAWAHALYLFMLYPQSVCLLLALLYGTSVLNAELDGKTITYLFTRPLAKWRIVTGKYLSVAGCLAVASSASLAGSWLVLGAPGGMRFFLGLWTATVAGTAAYSAIFTAVGVFFRSRTLVLGILYALLIEFFLSFVPAVVGSISVTHYLRSIVVRMIGLSLPEELLPFVGDASLPLAGAVLAGITAAALGAASYVCARREYAVVEQV